jgi:adenosylcobinamide-GDP ribazoletransferase
MPRSAPADGWRLALGTLTALPVRPPSQVDTGTARSAVLLAPFAAAPLGVAVAGALWLGHHFSVDPFAAGLLAVGVLVLGTRAFHVDGLADTADGLTASYDRERSLAVMKSGATGPAGAAMVFVVLGLQAVGLGGLAGEPLAAGLLVCLSRAALALTCARGIPAAEGAGLRAPFAESVPVVVTLGFWIVVVLTGALGTAALGLSWRHTVAGFGVATLVVALLLRRCTHRLGGVTGDIFGASIELTLAALVVAAA